MTGGTPPPYKVVYSGMVRQEIRDLCARAYSAGRGSEALAALQVIDGRLHSDPRVYGEEKYRYQNLDLEVRAAAETPLIVHYAVHLIRPVVFVKRIAALSGHGF